MSDAPTPPEASGADPIPAPLAPPHPSPGQAPAPRQRRWDWRPKARWFAAEYLIVVLGVLTAVGINAWWSGQQAEAKETVYLRQLVADLSETERIMANRDSTMDRRTHHSVNELFLSFGSRPRPPRDSVEQWMIYIAWTASPRPVLGTAEALVASGDFGAVRDDSLRSAILRYLDVSRERMADQALYFGLAKENLRDLQSQGWNLYAAVDAQWDLREKRVRRFFAYPRPDTSGTAASPDWEYPFPYDPMEIYESRDFFETLAMYRVNVGELQVARRVFARSAAELREQVTRVIGE